MKTENDIKEIGKLEIDRTNTLNKVERCDDELKKVEITYEVLLEEKLKKISIEPLYSMS